MNARERLLKALQQGEPDRVFFRFGVDVGDGDASFGLPQLRRVQDRY